MRIIVVEDDSDLQALVVERLRMERFHVAGVGSALEFYREMAEDSFDIAIVDVGLPDASGFDIAEWLRRRGGTGVILLTGLSAARDRVNGFRSGADLYFVKPVDGDVLVEAIHSLARRIVRGERSRSDPEEGELRWFFDPAQWTLQPPGADPVKLTAAEVRFIQRLIMRPGSMVPRADLRSDLGYDDDRSGDQSLDALVRRLRRKVEDQTGRPAPIQTVHGQGYLFSAPLRMERRSAPIHDMDQARRLDSDAA